MKICLVQPKAYHSWEALNIGYLKAYAQSFSEKWHFEFYSGYFDSDKEIIAGCHDADYVGFSCTTPQLIHARELIDLLKQDNSKAKTIIGGVHASAQPNHVLQFADYAVQGEGEMPLVKILLGNAKPGIVSMPFISKVDNLPYPDRHFVKQERNIAITEKNDKERIGAIFSSRGCPFRCGFCSSHEVWGRKARLHSPKRVVDEMEHLVNDWRIDFIKFSDDTFTLDEGRVWDICAELEKRHVKVPWGCNIRAGTSDKLLKRMKDSNCREVWIGAETGSDRILKEMRKGITTAQVRHIFEYTKQLGLYRRVYFMVGWPSETEQDIESTRELARQIDADQYGFSMLCPFPNNVVFKPEMLDGLDWGMADEYGNPWTKTETIGHDRLTELQDQLKREFTDKMCFRQRSDTNE